MTHFGSLPCAAAELPAETRVRAAAHVAVAGLTARPVLAGGNQPTVENAGGVGGRGHGAGAGLQGAVGEVAAEAVEHGVWLDRVVVVAPGGTGVEAGGGAGLGVGVVGGEVEARALGGDGGGGAGEQEGAAAEGTWRVDCQVRVTACQGSCWHSAAPASMCLPTGIV